ncbi:MAG TPA: 3-phosphoshikimate 1-carboxyvinyltransferase, partial [Gemmatimonadales bacterium]|nr:3-phosphoshikimate 1-carboxyvinyltransferase [Gemmatimonadales bacterium]
MAVPGSKSYTHRVLIAAALSDGRCLIENALESEDTHLTRDALKKWGVAIAPEGEALAVAGCQGEFKTCRSPLFLGNSGTSMRLLTAIAALVPGTSILTGSDRLRARPIQDLLDGLAQAGVAARSLDGNGCPPVAIEGGGLTGGRVDLNCALSSQFLSALLLVGPHAREGIEVRVTHGPVSRPYIDITLDTMASFGVQAERDGYAWFKVPGGQRYRAGRHRVEPDCSQAGYFWAAAAVTASTVSVRGARRGSRQGDIRILEILERMGCRVSSETDGVAVSGGPLSAVEVDMADIPDVVPTLAVTAAYARGRTVIRNVAHLRGKESDRLAAVSAGLARMRVRSGCDADTLWVDGGQPHGAAIDCCNDHRIAMSFAVAGLKTPGMAILDESCVQKSFPTFW